MIIYSIYNVYRRKKRMTIKIKGREYYLIKDLVELLPLTRESIGIYLRKGVMKGVKIGCRWMVSEKNLEAFLDIGGHIGRKILESHRES